jgi:hypothetical protein
MLAALSTGEVLAIVAAVVALGGAGLLGFFFVLFTVMGKTVRRETDEAIAPLSEAVVAGLERLDALRARREKLLGTGEAGIARPEGEMAAALERAGAQLREAGAAWTELEDRLSRARKLVELETRWGRANLDDARDLAKQKDTASPRVKAAADEAERLLAEAERLLLERPDAAPGLREPAPAPDERARDPKRLGERA